jgi:ubiquinone biosynthesis monooxygenase Coq6
LLPKIQLGGGDSIEAGLVIGADGANSLIRKSMLGVNYLSKDYKQMGLVGTVTFEDSETRDDTAFQKFMPSGPIALLPLRPGQASLVWTVTTDMFKPLKILSPEDFAAKLNSNLTKSYPSSSVIDAINSSVGMLLRPLRSLEDSMITSFPPPRATRVDNVAGFPLGIGHSERYVTNKS